MSRAVAAALRLHCCTTDWRCFRFDSERDEPRDWCAATGICALFFCAGVLVPSAAFLAMLSKVLLCFDTQAARLLSSLMCNSNADGFHCPAVLTHVAASRRPFLGAIEKDPLAKRASRSARPHLMVGCFNWGKGGCRAYMKPVLPKRSHETLRIQYPCICRHQRSSYSSCWDIRFYCFLVTMQCNGVKPALASQLVGVNWRCLNDTHLYFCGVVYSAKRLS